MLVYNYTSMVRTELREGVEFILANSFYYYLLYSQFFINIENVYTYVPVPAS